MRRPIEYLDCSRLAHNRLFSDHNQSLCSRAYYRQFADWRWRFFRVLVDALFWPIEREHCRKSFNRYW